MEHARPPPELCLEGGPACRADAWRKWLRQFQVFLKASGVYKESGDVQASLLINLIGSEGYDIFTTFKFDSEEKKDDIKYVIEKFNSYFGTKMNTTMVRYRFFTRCQEAGESIDGYVTALRLLSQRCEFEQLEDGLVRDRIVCGIVNTAVRDRLLRTDDLTLDKAIKICQANEISSDSEKQLEGVKSETRDHASVDTVFRGRQVTWRGYTGRSAGRGRFTSSGRRDTRDAGGERAGPSARVARACPACAALSCAGGAGCAARNAKCFVCGAKGHFKVRCPARNSVCEVYEEDMSEDTTSTTESWVARKPDSKPPIMPNNDVPGKPIVNYEDLATFINMTCIAPTYDKIKPAAELQLYKETRARVNTTYISMIMENNIEIACKNKTVEFKNAVNEFTIRAKLYSNMTFRLCDEVMEAIIYSVCYPADFYENSAPGAATDIRDCLNIIRLLFIRKVKINVGKRLVLRAYDTLREDTGNEKTCEEKATNFRNAIAKFMEIQEKYNNKLQLNTKVLQAVIDFICHKEYKDFHENESEFEERSKKCHAMFGDTVSLTTTSTPPPNVIDNNEDNHDTDIVTYLFQPSEKSESSIQYTKKEKYQRCLMLTANNTSMSIFDALSSLIPPVSNTTDTPLPIRKGFMGPVWMYLLIAMVIISLCGIGAFIIIRGRKQQEGLVEFELKPAQDVPEKTDIKY